MVKYYVKITDEQPTDDSNLWFELESGSDEKGEFFALRRNEYESLLDEFDTIKNKFEEEYVQPIVENKVNSYMSGLDSVSNSVNAENLINSEDPTQKHTWSSITSNFTRLYNEIANKVDTNTVTSLQNTLNNKAQSNHTHTNWTVVKSGDYYTLSANPSIKLCHFRYYRSGYKFTSTDLKKLHSGLIPSTYRPRGGDFVLPFYHWHIVGYIEDSTGDMYVKSDNKATYTINTSAVWSYK